MKIGYWLKITFVDMFLFTIEIPLLIDVSKLLFVVLKYNLEWWPWCVYWLTHRKSPRKPKNLFALIPWEAPTGTCLCKKMYQYHILSLNIYDIGTFFYRNKCLWRLPNKQNIYKLPAKFSLQYHKLNFKLCAQEDACSNGYYRMTIHIER
jgi:hypothetical protein